MTDMIRLGRWQDVLADVEACDALICDPPYGARTHEGHDASATGHGGGWTDSNGNRHAQRAARRELGYSLWTPDDVAGFVASWAPRCRGWFVAFTSHDLCPAYQAAYENAGLYAFAPLPWYCPGSRVRLSGDGPSSWTCWIMVARPRTQEMQRWGTLPGGYQTKPEACAVVGGKPLGLMRAIVRDYSRPGDLVVDPFCGSGTTCRAALAEGRRFVGAEQDPKHHAIAMQQLARGTQTSMV